MKINQVEELVGITKKNIRFYEDEGLITPDRNSQNGYREYTLQDVERLQKIKLLRQLDIPIEKIRMVQEGKLTFDACMEEQQIRLKHRQHDLEIMQMLCEELSDEVDKLDELDSSKYFEEMKRMEEGGVHFMDITKTDTRKAKRGPIIAAVVSIGFMLVMAVLIFWGNSVEPAPLGVMIITVGFIAAVVVGIIVALTLRLHEIDGGELDEARKY